MGVAAYWIANIVFYGFGEEVGWRGVALPCLQRNHSSVLLSLVWAGWHLPLFGVPQSMGSLGVAGVPDWYFSLLLGSVLMTWLYNSTGGSILAVALFHGVLDIVINSPGAGAIIQNGMGALVTIWGFMVLNRVGPINLPGAANNKSTGQWYEELLLTPASWSPAGGPGAE